MKSTLNRDQRRWNRYRNSKHRLSELKKCESVDCKNYSGRHVICKPCRKLLKTKPKVKVPKPVVKKKVKTTSTKRRAFYESKAWQDLRYKVLKVYGCKCMLCYARDCEMHVDHIKPRSKFPNLELSFDNLQVLCRACNLGKGNSDDTDFRPVNASKQNLFSQS